MGRLSKIFKNPFNFGSSRSGHEDRFTAYVIREHQRGRSLEEILNDRYLVNRTTPQQRERLLDSPAVIRAIGDDTIESAKQSLDS